MSEYPEIAERFARETAGHEMTVLHDDGLYRHLRFMNPKSSGYWFDLITVPGALIFRGDGESFVFSRVADMFEFFRSGIWEDGSLHINPGYWSEKLTSDRDSVKKYNQALFERLVKEEVALAIWDRSAPRGIGRAIRELLEYGDVTWEDGARRAVEEFEYRRYTASCFVCDESETFSDDGDAVLWCARHVRGPGARHRTAVVPGDAFRFENVYEWDFRDYDWWFLWACYGIVWGITRYDAARAEAVGQ